MTDRFHLVAHPALSAHLRSLYAESLRDPSGPEARQFAAVRTGMSALRNGREADFDGKPLGLTTHDLRDCAEIKLPVVEEFSRRGNPMGPSHRLTYREFDGPTPADDPVRQVIAFEPRKDGEAFTVTADRLGRSRGVPLDQLEPLPPRPLEVDPEAVRPPRQPLPAELAAAIKALGGQRPATEAVNTPPADQERPPERRTTPGSPSLDRWPGVPSDRQ